MDKLQLTGQNLGRVSNSRGGGLVYAMHSCGYLSKLLNLKLKTRPKQLLGYLILAFVLPRYTYYIMQNDQNVCQLFKKPLTELYSDLKVSNINFCIQDQYHSYLEKAWNLFLAKFSTLS
jgi:hypothetical protein